MYIFWLIVLNIAYFTQGVLIPEIGALWPRYVKELGLNVYNLSLLNVIMYVFAVPAEATTYKLRKKIGNTYPLILGFILCIFYIVFMYIANNLFTLCIAIAFLGVGISLIDATSGAFSGLYYEAKHISWMYAVCGLGGVFSSFVISRTLLPGENYKKILFYSLFFIIINIILLVLTKILLKKNMVNTGDIGIRVRAEKVDNITKVSSVIKNKYVLIMLLIFFLVDSVKIIMSYWLPTYLVNVGNATDDFAAIGVTFFLGSYMVSRIVFGILSNFLNDKKIITIGCIITVIGYICAMFLTKSNYLTIFFIVISGLGSGVLYPFFVHFANGVFSEKEARVLIGFSGTCACMGNVVCSFAVGMLVNAIGMKYIFLYQLVIVLLIIIFFVVLCLKRKKVVANN